MEGKEAREGWGGKEGVGEGKGGRVSVERDGGRERESRKRQREDRRKVGREGGRQHVLLNSP